MSEQLLAILKLCLLALLYLFFFRVLRAVWVEIKGPTLVDVPARKSSRADKKPAKQPRSTRARKEPVLEVIEPESQRGTLYSVVGEMTLGRAAGCQVPVDDTFVSQLHARVFVQDGQVLVEDLGSTNGTYLNRQRVSGPMHLTPGDQLQVGNTILELR